MIKYFKRLVARKELEELERWRIEWEEHRRWFAEFEVAALALDHMKARVDRLPVTNIMTVRDSCRTIN